MNPSPPALTVPPFRRRAARSPRAALAALAIPVAAFAATPIAAQDGPVGSSVEPPGVEAPADPDATDAPPRRGFTGRPRWEVGVGGGYLESFDYPGSKDPNRRSIALPFGIYRGPVLRLGDGGVRAMAIEGPRLQLSVSIGGSLSSATEADGVRAGMDDLDYLFEVGPRAKLVLADRATGDGGRFQASASLAVRGVVSTDFDDLEGRGSLGEIALRVARRRVAGSRFDVLAGVGAKFAEDRLHEYFYEVEPRFATAERPAFDASGGYLGARLSLGVAFRPNERVRLFAGVAHDRFDGAANENSPLFETDSATAVAVGFAWSVFVSRARVEIVDVE